MNLANLLRYLLKSIKVIKSKDTTHGWSAELIILALSQKSCVMKQFITVWIAQMVVLAGVSAPDPPATESRPSCLVVLTLRGGDGWIKARIFQKAIVFRTAYGKIDIPLEDILELKFGFHCPPELEAEIAYHIKQLGSNMYRERVESQKLLMESEKFLEDAQHFALPYLRKTVAADKDPERVKRANVVIRKIEAKCSKEFLNIKEEDVVVTKEWGVPIPGRIEGREFREVSAKRLGDFSPVKFSNISMLEGEAQTIKQEVFVDAGEHSSTKRWNATGIFIRRQKNLSVKADGRVDLWPQGPGQYMTGPKGYNTAGQDTNMMAGTLLGKIGEQGTVFVVGELYDEVPQKQGELFLAIVPAPWNNSSVGQYRCVVTVAHATR